MKRSFVFHEWIFLHTAISEIFNFKMTWHGWHDVLIKEQIIKNYADEYKVN